MATLVMAIALLLPQLSAAATAKKRAGPVTKDWDEVERGLYITGAFGGGFLLGAPGDSAPSLLGGLSYGLAVGYDLAHRVELEASLAGVQVGAPASYRGEASGTIAPGGDFATLLLGARLRYGYLGISDVQGIERFFLTVSAGGGLLTSAPSSQLGGFQPLVFGGTGFRYYTRMRHFSVGLDLEVAFGIGTSTLVLHPQLGLAYTF